MAIYRALLRPMLFRADAETVHGLAIRTAELASEWHEARHAAKAGPGRPRRIDEAVGAVAPTSLRLLDPVARRTSHCAP